MIFSIFSLEIINVVKPGPNIFLWITASVCDAVAVNSNGIKTSLANGLSIVSIKGNPVFSKGPKNQLENCTDCPMLCKWVFDNFILAEELFPEP